MNPPSSPSQQPASDDSEANGWPFPVSVVALFQIDKRSVVVLLWLLLILAILYGLLVGP